MAVRWISALFTAIPALVFSLYMLGSSRDEYFWTTYAATSFTYITASLFLGLALTPRLQHSRLGRPWMWIGLQGLIAWMVTLLALALLNLTPLCIGQDNGDGLNDLGLCTFYTMVVSLVFTPLVMTLLALCAAMGGRLIGSISGQGTNT